MNVLIKFGTDVMSKNFTTIPTVGQVISSASVKAELGFGDNVRALVNGVEKDNTELVEDGSTIIVEVRANSKAKWKAIAIVTVIVK